MKICTPAAEPSTPPASSTSPILKSTVLRCRCASRAENDEPAIWFAAEATATAGGMPMKNRSGVRMKPPPTPNIPESSPTIVPMTSSTEPVDGDLGDGEVDLHRTG